MVRQAWRDVAFRHWRYDPAVVQRCLPAGLTVDTFGGAAWIGLTPFRVVDERFAVLPALPRVSDYPETNLRTYVVGPGAIDGLWFFTIEVASLPTSIGAHTALALPYHRADMGIVREGPSVTYRSRRGDGTGNTTTIVTGHELDRAHRDLAGWTPGVDAALGRPRWRRWSTRR